MEPARPSAQTLRLIQKGASSAPAGPDVCPLCFGAGMEVVPGKGARRCDCRHEEFVARTVERDVPFIYRPFRLETLEPRADRHTKQARVIEHLKRKPDANYYFWGDNGSGKTLFLWLMFRRAVEGRRRAWGGTVQQLLDDYERAIEADKRGFVHVPKLRPHMLQEAGSRWALCLDDLDKPKVTEWTASKFFEIVNAAYNGGHQLITTANCSSEELEGIWEVKGGHYGRSIVRRLLEGAFTVEFPRERRARSEV